MDEIKKNSLLEKLKEHIGKVQQVIASQLQKNKRLADMKIKDFTMTKAEDQLVFFDLTENAQERDLQLKSLHSSPYFVKCELEFEDEKERRDLYFAKFQLAEEAIYSWVAPAASLRFEKPGNVIYTLPNGKERRGTLFSKEQYMIVDGKPVFFSKEGIYMPRQLIHQEHFSTRKAGFMLPEIVERMEKAQDQVIRAHHRGPLVISGPAGSGKTTLALHRVAYLIQSPETTSIYPAETIAVFVQDSSTKNYFSHLLPELGINAVKITTFEEWARNILALESFSFVVLYGKDETEKELYEYKKLKAMRNYFKEERGAVKSKSASTVLTMIYQKSGDAQTMELFKKQIKEKKVDRIDLTILLRLELESKGKLWHRQERRVRNKKDEWQKRIVSTPLEYSLMLVDEFQNYLPEQLSIFKNCFGERDQAVLYVGDMAQQIQFGTLRNWQEIGEVIAEPRKIILQKVYRNTKSILQYIERIGYKVDIPAELDQGVPVEEYVLLGLDQEKQWIKQRIGSLKEGSVAILSRSKLYADSFKDIHKEGLDIHVMSMREAQGLEFDTVFIVGIGDSLNTSKSFEQDHKFPSTVYFEEKARIEKDLLYVALTRAIKSLVVLGRVKLSEINASQF